MLQAIFYQETAKEKQPLEWEMIVSLVMII